MRILLLEYLATLTCAFRRLNDNMITRRRPGIAVAHRQMALSASLASLSSVWCERTYSGEVVDGRNRSGNRFPEASRRASVVGVLLFNFISFLIFFSPVFSYSWKFTYQQFGNILNENHSLSVFGCRSRSRRTGLFLLPSFRV